MANFDEFDAQSQALLTSLQQNNKFLSFQDLNKGFPDTETFNSSSYKTFDEISQQRSLSSPLGQNSIFSKPQREIFENLITYPQTKKIWRYKVISDVNATQLIKEFREDNSNIKNSRGPYDDELDFIIYAEQNDGSISLGRVLLFKVSDAMVKEYPNNEIPEDFAKKIHEQQQNNPNFKYTVSEIHEAFINSIKLQAHQVSDISILDVENIIKKISTTLSIFFHEDLKFSREQWDPTLKSDKYLFDTPQKAINYIINKCNDSIKELKQLKEKLLVIQSFSISGFEFNTPYVESIIKAIDSQIESINKFKTWLLENKNEIQTDIPYLCGIWNGFIEFIAGIVDVIVLAVNIILSEVLEDSINLDLLEIREGVEEIIEKLVDAIKKDPSTIINGIINSIKQYKYTRYDAPSLNKYQLQYNEGEDTILAIDIIATIVVIVKGIAKLGKLLPKFSKWIDDLLKGNGKGARKIQSSLLKRGKYLGQVLEETDLIKVEKFLKKYNTDLQIGPPSGAFQIEEFFYPSGRVFEMSPKNAALFITDGKKMKLVIRENATLYELLHELMHLRDCRTTGLKAFMKKPLVDREQFVYEKLVEYSKFLNRKELGHAENYINWHYGKAGKTDNLGNPLKEVLPFDLKDIPNKRQEINIDKILSLK